MAWDWLKWQNMESNHVSLVPKVPKGNQRIHFWVFVPDTLFSYSKFMATTSQLFSPILLIKKNTVLCFFPLKNTFYLWTFGFARCFSLSDYTVWIYQFIINLNSFFGKYLEFSLIFVIMNNILMCILEHNFLCTLRMLHHGFLSLHYLIKKVYLLFSHSVVSFSLQLHGLQQARLPCPPSPRACSNSCPLSWWCLSTISSSVVPFSSCPVFQSNRGFSNEPAFHSRWAKYWSFVISPSNEYSRLISFRIDWLDLLTLKSSPTTEFRSINSDTQPSLWYKSHIHTWLLEKP